MSGLREALRRAQEDFADGEYFECHERLEGHWMRAAGGEKELLQGVIQLAAAMHALSLSRARRAGALWLYRRGRAKIERRAGLLPGADLAGMWRSWEAWARALAAEETEPVPCLSLIPD